MLLEQICKENDIPIIVINIDKIDCLLTSINSMHNIGTKITN